LIARVGGWTIEFSREDTLRYYESLERGDSELCGCIYCRNFAAQRERTFGPPAREFLAQFGIDWQKEGEVVEYGRCESVTFSFADSWVGSAEPAPTARAEQRWVLDEGEPG
jgi:hypothetical protein